MLWFLIARTSQLVNTTYSDIQIYIDLYEFLLTSYISTYVLNSDDMQWILLKTSKEMLKKMFVTSKDAKKSFGCSFKRTPLFCWSQREGGHLVSKRTTNYLRTFCENIEQYCGSCCKLQ